ncbi:MAG: 50S ribosomal protein L18 [Chlamydiales bacterium]|nr:50S ribosomal protein L18 [Chlamydiales bacterium]
MNNEISKRNVQRFRRKLRVRKAVRGTAQRPRLCVLKTNAHISAQIIDDEAGVTLVSAGTMTKEFRDQKMGRKSKQAAHKVGTKLAELAQAKNIQFVVFDRGHHKYHGVLAALADGAREVGLQF